MYVVSEKIVQEGNMDRVMLAHAMLAAAMGLPVEDGASVFLIEMPQHEEDMLPVERPDAILSKKSHLVRRRNGQDPWGTGSRKSSLKASSKKVPRAGNFGRRVYA